jgi:hypothetical protein
MLVKLKAPEGCYEIGFGKLLTYPDKDGTLSVPGSVADAFIEAGFTKADDQPKEEEGADEAFDTTYHLMALGIHPPFEGDPKEKLKELLDRRGSPKVRINP